MSVETSRHRTRPILGIAISIGLLTIIALAELTTATEDESDVGIGLAVVLLILISGLLVAKRPDHPVSWLVALTALIGAIAAISADVVPPGITEIVWWRVPLAMVSGPSWYGLFLTFMVLIPLLFPTGSPLSPRWRWVGRLAVGAFLLMTMAWMFQERFCTGSPGDGCPTTVANPIGIGGLGNPEESIIGTVVFGTLFLSSLAAITSLIVRYRRSVGVERSQIKWVLFSVGVFVGSLALNAIWVDVLDQPELTGPAATVVDALWVAVPASIALAILRYRLYDIDRIISRTLSYALILGLLGLTALGLISVFAVFLPTDDPLVVAISTLVVAALFNPVRRRVQAVIDRRFNRSRFDAERVIEGFARTLRDQLDPEGVVDGWVGVVSRTMQPSSLGIWVKRPVRHAEIPVTLAERSSRR